MLRHRIEGVLGLHSALLALAVCGVFLGVSNLLPWMGWVTYADGVRLELYFLGVMLAMAWSHRHLRAVGAAYGHFGWLDALRLTARQGTRLMVTLFGLAFVLKDVALSRTLLIVFLAAAGGVMVFCNYALPRFFSRFMFRSRMLRTLLVASPDEVQRLEHWAGRYRDLGVEVVGYLAERNLGGLTRLPWLGRPDTLEAAVTEHGIHQVLLDQQGFAGAETLDMRLRAEQLGCRVRCFVDLSLLLPFAGSSVEHDGRYAFASFTPEPLDNPLNRVAKRFLDLFVAVPVILFVLPPLFGLTKILQTLQSPGPLLYRQRRTGVNGRKFTIYKLRTMHVDDGANEARQATAGDSRVYAFGRFLRQTSLDELPQFLNVIEGNMSVVGPRPHLVQHDEEFARIANSYRRRHYVKPGITGLAQAHGLRGEIREDAMLMARLRRDVEYVTRWSLLMDLMIFLRTVRQVIKPPPSAY